MSKRVRTISKRTLDGVSGGLRIDDARLSQNIEDRRGEYTPLEDGGLYEHSSGRVVEDGNENQSLGGYRDDPTTGDRTWINGEGTSVSIERQNGEFALPGTPVEDGLYDHSTGQTIPDPSANQDPGGWRWDPDTGNTTHIGANGESTGVTTSDGRELPAYTPVEDGLFDNGSNQVVDDFTANQNLGGYRDDPDNGDRTYIDGNGDTLGVQREDGSFASPHIPVEDGLYNTETNQVENDFTANQNPGGYRDDPDTGDRTFIDGSGQTVDDGSYDQGLQELSDITQSFGNETSE